MQRLQRGRNQGSLTRRPDGRWEARVTLPDGTRRSFYGPTEQDAHRKLVEALYEQQNNDSGTEAMRVGDFLDTWLERVAKPRIRPQTYKSYEVNIRVHLKPALGRLRLDQLQPAHIQDLIEAKVKAGLAPKSIQYMHSVLRNALNHAVRWEYIGRNPAALVDKPRSEHHEILPFSREEAHRFLSAIKGNRLEALYTVALTMGLRQGEALGLRWRDVDLDMGYIRVSRQLQRVNHKYELVELKTKRSQRPLAVPPAIMDTLVEHKRHQADEREAAGRRWHETDLVFTRPDGYPLSGSVVTHTFQDLLSSAGLQKRRFHDLRHSCATLLLAQGVSPRVVMEILGHSQISLTMNTYAHVLPEMGRDAANRMSDLLRGENDDR
jgi:integrase